MSAYSDCYALVVALTNRSALSALTDAQIRAAIRKGHRAGSFPRDVKTVTVSGLSTSSQIQTIDLAANCPRLRQLKTVKPVDYQDVWYKDEDIGTLLDPDGVARVDIFWQVGSTLSIRAAAPVTSVQIYYFDLPDLTDLAASTDWVLTSHGDLVAHWAAAAILGSVGEQEARSRIEALAAEFYEDLIEESVEIVGR